jgi:hypothetical protein
MLLPLTAQPLVHTVEAIVMVTGPGNVTTCVPLERPALHEYQAAEDKKPADLTMNAVESPISAEFAVAFETLAPIAIAFDALADDR